jgi:hypothetical protein
MPQNPGGGWNAGLGAGFAIGNAMAGAMTDAMVREAVVHGRERCCPAWWRQRPEASFVTSAVPRWSWHPNCAVRQMLAPLPADAKFCNECGAKQKKPTCKLQSGTNTWGEFCNECGQKL